MPLQALRSCHGHSRQRRETERARKSVREREIGLMEGSAKLPRTPGTLYKQCTHAEQTKGLKIMGALCSTGEPHRNPSLSPWKDDKSEVRHKLNRCSAFDRNRARMWTYRTGEKKMIIGSRSGPSPRSVTVVRPDTKASGIRMRISIARKCNGRSFCVSLSSANLCFIYLRVQCE